MTDRSLPARSIPARPDLDQLKRQAKELLKAYREGDASARQRWSADPSFAQDVARARLRDAQRVLACEYGFASWDALSDHVRRKTGDASGGAPPRARRGLVYEDTISPDDLALRGPLTHEIVRRLADQQVTGVKLDASTPADSLIHLADLPTLRRVDLSGRDDLVDRDLAFLASMPWLTAVSLGNCRAIGDAGVAYLRQHDALEEINLQWTATGDEALRLLAGKPRLHRVSVGGEVTDAGAALLREYPALRAPGAPDAFLAVSSSSTLTDRALAALGDLAGVVALDVHCSIFGSRQYTVAGVAHLPRMASLEELNFLGVLTNDAVLREIARIPRLRRLSCQEMIAGDEGFVALGRCATLEWIWGRMCPRIGDRGFAALGHLSALRTLALGGQNVRDEAMAAIVDLPALEELQPILFGDAAFAFIAKMPRLVKLTNMYNRDTTDAATAHLRGHPRLAHYGAHGTQITDASLDVIADLPAIETVDVENCDRITDAGLVLLSRAPRLRRVSVGSCLDVSGAWTTSLPRIETAFDPANRGYVERYRFWTLLDYPDMPVPAAWEPPATSVSADLPSARLLARGMALDCRAAPREDGLHVSVEAGGRWVHRSGWMTREAVAAPVRLDLVVRPIDELRLYVAGGQIVFDAHGTPQTGVPWPNPWNPRSGQTQNPRSEETQETRSGEAHPRVDADSDADVAPQDGWTRVTLEIESHECRLFIDGVRRHTWPGEVIVPRQRLAIGPRRSSVTLRALNVEPLRRA